MKKYRTVEEAYYDVLTDVFLDYEYKVNPHVQEVGKGKYIPNGGPTREKLNYQFTVLEPKVPVFKSRDSSRDELMNRYMAREIELFDEGIIDATIMSAHSKLWGRIANPDGTINANYGYMALHLKDAGNLELNPDEALKTQWEWALTRLINDKDSRQAYLHFNRPKDQWEGNKDQPCTVFVQFIIRDNRLHFTSYMRSNDLVYGTPYNLGYFAHMMDMMLLQLKPYYPELAMGTLTHNATSIHIYDRHLDKVQKMLGVHTSFGENDLYYKKLKKERTENNS